MTYLAIAQFMAAATFFTIAMIHIAVWGRARSQLNHLLFAVAAAAAGANAIAEFNMYQSSSIEQMSTAMQWYVGTSGLWAIATVCFICSYAQVSRFGRGVSTMVVLVLAGALVVNFFSPNSFLYTKISGLREIHLPWGEEIHLAIGENNPIRLVTDLALAGIFLVVIDGCIQMWRKNQRSRSLIFGWCVSVFIISFATHAFLVDTGQLDSFYISTYGFLALVGLTSYDLAGDVIRQSQLSLELQQKETQLRTAVEDERNRIAGDLHDSVTQTLFSTAAIADALPEVWEKDPAEARRGLRSLKSLTKSALAEMRTLLVELRPASLTQKNLGELLRQLAIAQSGRTRVPIDVEITGDRRLSRDVQIALYRVAQEALNNVSKHSRATQVWVQLNCENGTAALTVRDNGRGFANPTDESTGMGLQIMRERVRAIGGDLQIESEPEDGTTVTVHWQQSTIEKGKTDG